MQYLTRATLLVVAVLLLLVPGTAVAAEWPQPPADGELVRVVAITDGDTIRVERADGSIERVRYIGIDTPEISHEAGEPDEPWGPEATEANRRLAEDERVLLERDVSDTDHYDRLLRYVWVEAQDGWLMVNGELVSLGLADVRAYEPDTRHDEWLRELERDARESGVGMHGGEPEPSGSFLDDVLDFLFGG